MGLMASPQKEVMLQIFIALKNPSLSASSEHTNLGSNGKHNNHYTTDNDIKPIMIVILWFSSTDLKSGHKQ
jgi:hypothetical protein